MRRTLRGVDVILRLPSPGLDRELWCQSGKRGKPRAALDLNVHAVLVHVYSVDLRHPECGEAVKQKLVRGKRLYPPKSGPPPKPSSRDPQPTGRLPPAKRKRGR